MEVFIDFGFFELVSATFLAFLSRWFSSTRYRKTLFGC
jgi:hypothetical protein